ITGMMVTGPGGAQVEGSYPAHLRGAALTRADLDQLLLDAATGAGAVFEPHVRVVAPHAVGRGVGGVLVAGGGTAHVLAARVVIAADGRGSRLASAMRVSRFAARPRRWAFGAYFEGVA